MCCVVCGRWAVDQRQGSVPERQHLVWGRLSLLRRFVSRHIQKGNTVLSVDQRLPQQLAANVPALLYIRASFPSSFRCFENQKCVATSNLVLFSYLMDS